MANVRLHRFSVCLACTTLLLLIAGGLVTSRDAALSVPDWPLSYGRLIPPLQGNIVYEFAHRATAGLVAILTLILAIWTQQADSRRWMKRLAWGAVAAVLAQAILGGIAVKWLVPRPITIGHATVAQLYFVLTVAMALFLSPSWQAAYTKVDDPGRPLLHYSTLAASGLLLVQSVLGASVRHEALTAMPHIGGAAIATLATMWAGMGVLMRYMDHQTLRRSALWSLSLVFSQVFLGLGAYMSRIATADAPQPMPMMIGFTVAHVAGAALALAASAVLTLQVFHHVRPVPALSAGKVAMA